MKNSERSFARRIDLTSLQLFVAVCELGSIGRAAEREYIAASAVSKRLSDLEAAVDTALLYRHSRGVTLTPAGESLLHHARNVLYGLERMQGELSEYSDGVRGHVRMHATISSIVQFLPEDLGSFAREHSQIKIDLQEHLSADVLQAVHDIPGAPRGAYWDGGITDYHLHWPWQQIAAQPDSAGLVLYPHFQSRLVPGWLDKGLKWRHKATSALDNMVVLSPDPDWVRRLPNAKLPDRNDFTHYGTDSRARAQAWLTATRASQQLVDEWREWLERPDMGAVQPL